MAHTPPGRVNYVYLARRRAGLDDEAFLRRWREHSALAGRYPELMRFICGYAQARVRSALTPPATPPRWDAIGVTTCFDAAALAGMLACPATREVLHPDELRVFDAPCAQFALATRTLIDRPGELGPYRFAQFVRRRNDASPALFTERWSAAWQERLGGTSATGRVLAASIEVAVEPAACGYDGFARFTLVDPDDAAALTDLGACTDAQATITLGVEERVLYRAAER